MSEQPGSDGPPTRHIDLSGINLDGGALGQPSPPIRSSKGWDGKARVNKTASLANPEALSDPEYSDDENVAPGEEIAADEGEIWDIEGWHLYF